MLDTTRPIDAPPATNGHASLLDTKPVEIDMEGLSTGGYRRIEASRAGTSKTPVSDVVYVLQEVITNWTLEEIDSLLPNELMQLFERMIAAMEETAVPNTNAGSSNGHSLPAASRPLRGSRPISSVRRGGARRGS